MTVGIDTNVVLGMFGRNGPWLPIRQALVDRRLIWAVTTEILLEYEEVAAREIGIAAAAQLLRFIDLLEQTRGNIQHAACQPHLSLSTHHGGSGRQQIHRLRDHRRRGLHRYRGSPLRSSRHRRIPSPAHPTGWIHFQAFVAGLLLLRSSISFLITDHSALLSPPPPRRRHPPRRSVAEIPLVSRKTHRPRPAQSRLWHRHTRRPHPHQHDGQLKNSCDIESNNPIHSQGSSNIRGVKYRKC